MKQHLPCDAIYLKYLSLNSRLQMPQTSIYCFSCGVIAFNGNMLQWGNIMLLDFEKIFIESQSMSNVANKI